METVTWKARVTSTRMLERMRFLRAYWGRSTLTASLGAPCSEYPITQVILRCVERAYEEVIASLQAPRFARSADEQKKAEWWLKMARDGRNVDPFPGVSYGNPSPPADNDKCPGCDNPACERAV